MDKIFAGGCSVLPIPGLCKWKLNDRELSFKGYALSSPCVDKKNVSRNILVSKFKTVRLGSIYACTLPQMEQ